MVDFSNLQTNGTTVTDEDVAAVNANESESETDQTPQNKKKLYNPKVYYFKPNTYLLDEPEKQRHYRNALVQKVKSIPQLSSRSLLAEDL